MKLWPEPTTALRRIGAGAAVTLVLRIAGGGCELLLNLYIARMFGAEGAGLFFMALTVTMVASVLARLGLDNSLLRLASTHAAGENWSLLDSIARRGLLAALLASALAAGLVYATVTLLQALRPEYAATAGMTSLAAMAIVPLSLACLYGELLKSVRRIFASQLVSAVAIPAVTLVVMTATGTRFGIGTTVVAYDVAAMAAALLGWYWWKRAVPRHDVPACEEISWRSLFDGTWSFLWIKCARLATSWCATAALATWATHAEVGIYGVALRVSLALSLLLMAVNSVVAPRFAIEFHRGDHRQLDRSAGLATGLVLIFAGPLVGLFLFAPDWVMGWFGSEFASRGAPVLYVLALGQLVNLLTGPVGYLLMMSGNEQSLQHCMTLSVVVGAATIALLTPAHGALGAAIGTAAAMILQSLAASWFVWSRLGIVTIPLLRVCVSRLAA